MTKTLDEELRLEHRQLRRRLEALRLLGDKLETATTADVAAGLDAANSFLQGELVPHAMAEEEVLYPAIAVLLGGEHTTDTMSRDHLEIARLVQELAHLGRRFAKQPMRSLRRDIRRVLYELEAIALLHMDKEDEVYLPLLDAHIDDTAAADLIQAMHTASHRAATRWAS